MSGNSNITYSLTPASESGRAYTFDFPVPVGTYNISVITYDSSWNSTTTIASSSSSKSIARKQMLRLPDLLLNTTYLMEDFEDGEIPSALKGDSSYQTQFGSQFSIVDNPGKTPANMSDKVLKLDMHNWADASGYSELDTHASVYSDIHNFRSGATGFRMKVRFASAAEAAMYCPYTKIDGAKINGDNAPKMPPTLVNGKSFDGSAEAWASLIKPDEWNVLQWDASCSGAYNVILRPLVALDGTQKKEGSKTIYLDDFEYIK